MESCFGLTNNNVSSNMCIIHFAWLHGMGTCGPETESETYISQQRQYSSTCHEGTLPVRSQSVPSWQVVPRGRDSNFDTNIYGHTSSARVRTAIMHKQNRSGGYENREIPIT